LTEFQIREDIAVEAPYDPGFFPDNKGFTFAGVKGGDGFCSMDLIQNFRTSRVTFNEEQCFKTETIGVYQQVGTSLGGDYFITSGAHENDDAGQAYGGKDIGAGYPSWSAIKITAMVHDGKSFNTQTPVDVVVPYDGDPIISPSAELVSLRTAGPNSRQSG